MPVLGVGVIRSVGIRPLVPGGNHCLFIALLGGAYDSRRPGRGPTETLVGVSALPSGEGPVFNRECLAGSAFREPVPAG